MKKTFAIILIALMAMTAVFAVAPETVHKDDITVIKGENVELKVSLSVDPGQMHFYSFGFTDSKIDTALKATDNSTLPDARAKDTLVLDFKPGDSMGKSPAPVYFYYKTRTDAKFKFKFDLQKALFDQTNEDSLDWNATIKQSTSSTDAMKFGDAVVTKIDTSSTASVEGIITPSGEGYHWGIYSINFATAEIPMLSTSHLYEGSLKVTISSVS